MAEANEPAAERDAEFFPLNDLPNDVLVSVFAAAEDPTWVRHTFPLVCRAWNELYRTKDASPLHETLEIVFKKEAKAAAREWEDDDDDDDEVLAVDASRVIAWAERRAGSVRKLRIVCTKDVREDLLLDDLSLEDFGFSSEDLGELVDVVGPSLTDIFIGPNLSELCERPFWETLRDSVVPFGLLRSLEVAGIESALLESDLEPLGQLAGSLEELVLETLFFGDRFEKGLPRFPESLFALKELRRLVLYGQPRITAIPAGISSLKKLKDLELRICGLSLLPKELGELSGLTKLDVGGNPNLGTTAEAFPAELGKMKPLRNLRLSFCGLRAVPLFVRELKSLENLVLVHNEDLGDAPEDEAFPAALGKLKSLQYLYLHNCGLRAVPAFVGELASLEVLSLSWNEKLGNAPEDEAFPAALGKLKSLRELDLSHCRLRVVPSFVGKLESLEDLDLSLNSKLQIDAPLDFLIEGCPRLRSITLTKDYGGVFWTPRSLANLEAFKAKLRAKNPGAKVFYDFC